MKNDKLTKQYTFIFYNRYLIRNMKNIQNRNNKIFILAYFNIYLFQTKNWIFYNIFINMVFSSVNIFKTYLILIFKIYYDYYTNNKWLTNKILCVIQMYWYSEFMYNYMIKKYNDEFNSILYSLKFDILKLFMTCKIAIYL